MSKTNYSMCKDCDVPALPCKAECLERHKAEEATQALKPVMKPSWWFQAAIWVQLNFPVIYPLVDRIFHLAGICVGH